MALGKLPDDEAGGDGGIFADINITPLTDIFLVLLIIFMVTAAGKLDEATKASSSGVNGISTRVRDSAK